MAFQRKMVGGVIIAVINVGVSEFLPGGTGIFNWLCALQVRLPKVEHPAVKNYLVIDEKALQRVVKYKAVIALLLEQNVAFKATKASDKFHTIGSQDRK